MEEGIGRGNRLRWRAHPHPQQCARGKREGRQHSRRSDVLWRAVLLRPLSGTLQPDYPEV